MDLIQPCFKCLGCPIPLDEHAVSVTIPTWADVVGYEEGDPRILSQLNIGYPRFKIHAGIEKLMECCIRRRQKLFLASMKQKEVFIPVGHTSFTWNWVNSEKSLPCGHSDFSWNRKHPSDVFVLGDSVTVACFLFPSRAVAERFKDFMVRSFVFIFFKKK